MRHIGDERIIQALKDAKGFISAAAAKLGCERHTVANRIKRRAAVGKAYEEIVESRLDVAESKLMVAVDMGQPWAVQYLLDNKGKGRGYGKREVQVKAEADVKVARLDEALGSEILARLAPEGT